jgi:hypothetical protein
MSLNGELKHLFGVDVYAEAKASMKVLPDSELIKKLAIHARDMRSLSGQPDQQRDFVQGLPSNEKTALCRALIR